MNLPPSLARLIDPSSLSRVSEGKSGAEIYKAKRSDGQSAYLKISNNSWSALEIDREIQAMNWLKGKLPVPALLGNAREGEKTYLLMSEIPGKNLAEIGDTMSAEDSLRLSARFLKRIHSIDIAGCPLNRRLSVTIPLAEKAIREGLVDETDFDETRKGFGAREIFDSLVKKKPASEDIVFTHGDYCLPNIIHSNSKISGVVDLGRSGFADRYQDIALLLRSFEFSHGSPQGDIFLEEYKLLERLDPEKLEFFQILDEFF